MVKTSSLEALEQGRTQLQLLQSLDPGELLFDLSCESLEDHLQGCCVWLTQHLSMSNAFTLGEGGGDGGKHLSEKGERQDGFTSSSWDRSDSDQRSASFSVLGSYEFLLLLLSLLLLPKVCFGAGALENENKKNTGDSFPLSAC